MKITIYTTNTCAYCSQLKAWLTRKDVEYTTINLSEHPEKQQEAFALSGALTVPVTLIEKENKRDVVIGFNLSKLVPLIS